MPGVFEIIVETHFSAAHRLCGYSGDCSRLHGHNWVVEVAVRCLKLDNIGIGIDFRTVKASVKQLLARMDHVDLNELPEFKHMNPTSENIAKYLYRELSKLIGTETISVSRVKVIETPGAGAVYWEE
jgi:6-pyruvoyltetrahydropterin/6-carboxytetrahydropterin synthase